MPLDVLCTGTPEQVRACCKELIDIAAPGGGFIFSSGAPMQGARPENVRAMITCAKAYGAGR
jgi:uroporphyrinogen-III decarboxylase